VRRFLAKVPQLECLAQRFQTRLVAEVPSEGSAALVLGAELTSTILHAKVQQLGVWRWRAVNSAEVPALLSSSFVL
jgi:hypothetical protein